jgi:hypothetical protein
MSKDLRPVFLSCLGQARFVPMVVIHALCDVVNVGSEEKTHAFAEFMSP